MPSSSNGVPSLLPAEAQDDWLFLKLRCDRAEQDRILVELYSAVRADRSLPDIPLWFFVRYSDRLEALDHGEARDRRQEGPHLRLRWHLDGDAERRERAARTIVGTARALGPVVLARYEPETQRYGGRHGIAVAHRIFAADSANVVDMLADRPGAGMLRFVVSAHDLLVRLGFSSSACTKIYDRQVRWATRVLYGDEDDVAALLEAAERTLERVGPALVRAHACLHHATSAFDALDRVGCELHRLDERGLLTARTSDFAVSVQHMHFNRAGMSRAQELSAVTLLHRAHVALFEHP